MSDDLFEFPDQPTDITKPKAVSTKTVGPSKSYVNTVPSQYGKEDVDYARLTQAEHEAVVETTDIIYEHRDSPAVRDVLRKPSGLIGRNHHNQTYGEVLDGIREKLNRKHPHLDRKGEDISIKQMNALNDILRELDIDPLPVPTK